MSELLRTIQIIVWKDLLLELRGRQVFSTTFTFALLVLVVFNFALDVRADLAPILAPGVLWVAIVFAGMLSIGRSFSRESDRGTIEALRVSPIDRSAIFIGKLLGNLIIMLAVELVTVPVFVMLFNLSPRWLDLVLITMAGTVGYVTVSTLFAAIAVQSRAREVMLPLLALPLLVPIVIGSAKATAEALTPFETQSAPWLSLIAAYDLIFLAIGVAIFDHVFEA
ncbi:MAG: heme exporter protein CcmB [Chloroflexota bacterium]